MNVDRVADVDGDSHAGVRQSSTVACASRTSGLLYKVSGD